MTNNKDEVRIKFISAGGCANCEKVARTLKENIAKRFPSVNVEEIDMASNEGQRLVAKHGILSSPGIVLDDELFASGNVDEAKLEGKIKMLLKNE